MCSLYARAPGLLICHYSCVCVCVASSPMPPPINVFSVCVCIASSPMPPPINVFSVCVWIGQLSKLLLSDIRIHVYIQHHFRMCSMLIFTTAPFLKSPL